MGNIGNISRPFLSYVLYISIMFTLNGCGVGVVLKAEASPGYLV